MASGYDMIGLHHKLAIAHFYCVLHLTTYQFLSNCGIIAQLRIPLRLS